MNYAVGWYFPPKGNNQEVDMRFEVIRENKIDANGR
jgi:hypothetical protein